MTSYDFNLTRDQLDAQMAYQGASLKEQKSARKAQDSYNQKRLELEQQGLGLQADQIAKQYAMDQAKLEWDKESFSQQFGHQVAQDAIDNAFREKQSALDETWRTAEQTGFRDGVPTLATMQFNEQTRQFDVNTAEQKRQYDLNFGENQRQFNTSAVLNAPRGPADWAAYTARMRGLQGGGTMPGAVGSMFDPNAQVASFSNGGQATGGVLSNTDLALAATGQGDPSKLTGTPWQGSFGTMPQQQSSASTSSPEMQSTLHTGSVDPYGGTNPTSSAAANALGMSQDGSGLTSPSTSAQQGTDMSLPSIQKFRKFAPTEQEMGLGYLAENGGPTEEDAKYLMSRQAPNYARSTSARFNGV